MMSKDDETKAMLSTLWTEIQATVALQERLGPRIRLLRPIWFRQRVWSN